MLTFEDTGDIGNEYIFFKPTEDQGITTENVTAEITNKENSPVKASYQIKQTVMLPVAADERLEEEQKAVREFRERLAQRSTTLRPFEITTVVTMIKESNQLFLKQPLIIKSKIIVYACFSQLAWSQKHTKRIVFMKS